ncbi:hypothetical protein [Microbulbifer halophilus]|uniref:Uncharacterized protein n=1 Tax=Microbulbifer halophilus TaxID=453963 RepID=A0ABW5EFQ5_9GAMM|nr:hypothetical protein [Microbulbifer halophilus]MCW8128239.1 hypothetical protein [Microbulbifer halophilus]
MLFSILVTLQIFSGLVAGESSIRQTQEGRKSLETLSNAGLFFLRWRAYADYKEDLKALRNIFGVTALIFIALFYVISPAESDSFFNSLPGLFIVLWLVMQFGTDFRKSVKEQFSIAGLLILGPWLLLGMDALTNFQFQQLRHMAMPFNAFDIQKLETYQIALVLSLVGGLIGGIMAVFSIVVFSMVPLFFLFLMALLSVASRFALKVQPKTARNLALLYCFIIGPVLMALESKGVI